MLGNQIQVPRVCTASMLLSHLPCHSRLLEFSVPHTHAPAVAPPLLGPAHQAAVSLLRIVYPALHLMPIQFFPTLDFRLGTCAPFSPPQNVMCRVCRCPLLPGDSLSHREMKQVASCTKLYHMLSSDVEYPHIS